MSRARMEECIGSVIVKMEPEEKGILKSALSYGKNLQEQAGKIINSSEELKKYGADVSPLWVCSALENAFTEGSGFTHGLSELTLNYGKQLDITINDVLVKSLNMSRPNFSSGFDNLEGALKREEWIVENLMNSLIVNMDEDARKELAKNVEKILIEKGITPGQAVDVGAIILTGGLTAAKTIMGFNFHILVAQIANMLVRALVGKGLSFAANATMQQIFGVLFGPIGWIITAIMALPLITHLANKREYDKFIPAVFIIGMTRMVQNSTIHDQLITIVEEPFNKKFMTEAHRKVFLGEGFPGVPTEESVMGKLEGLIRDKIIEKYKYIFG